MYTGIIRQVAPVARVERRPNLLFYSVRVPEAFMTGLALGDSVAVDGVCQSVAKLESDHLHFEAARETLDITTLSDLGVGQTVNLERSARTGDEMGGHPLSGHVDGTAVLRNVRREENLVIWTIELPEPLRRYVFTKGFIAVDGASLTVNHYDRTTGRFEVCLVPQTLERTTFGEKRENARLNIEIERQTQIIVDTIENALTRLLPRASAE
jgi:riboflavin synthase